MTPTRPRDKDGVVEAALLVAREKDVETAERRLQAALDAVQSGDRDLDTLWTDTVDGDLWTHEKHVLTHALGQLRKQAATGGSA